MIFLLFLGTLFGSEVERVDVIEVNYVVRGYRAGAYCQVILWKFYKDDAQFHVADYVMGEIRVVPVGENYRVFVVRYPGALKVVEAAQYRVRVTQKDPETLDWEEWPCREHILR